MALLILRMHLVSCASIDLIELMCQPCVMVAHIVASFEPQLIQQVLLPSTRLSLGYARFHRIDRLRSRDSALSPFVILRGSLQLAVSHISHSSTYNDHIPVGMSD